MAKDEKKKGKGIFGKIADAISGNQEAKPEQVDIPSISETINAENDGKVNDAIPDQGTQPELKESAPAPEINQKPKKVQQPKRSDKKAYLKWLAEQREERSKRKNKRF